MQWRLVLIAMVAGLLSLGCGLFGGDDGDGSRSYPTDFDPDDLDLEAMALRDEDMPERGLQELVSDTFTNAEWANAFASQLPETDPEQKQVQLDAQGRLLGYLRLFAWDVPIEHLGRTQQVESHSVVYVDEEAASDAMRFHACGLLVAGDQLLDPFEVPELGSESTGFFYETPIDPFGKFVDTVVCFRTGRVLHAVVQNGLDGTQDTEVSVQLARRMLSYVDAAFSGESAEETEDIEEG